MEHHTSPIIDIRGVSKTYTETRAVRDLSLQIFPGEFFALLGHNGAGKTTLIGMITGSVRIDRGTIHVCGHDVVRESFDARRCIGVVPQEMPLEPFITVERALRYQRGFFGRRQDNELMEQTLRTLSLWEKRHAQIRMLSGGMKRRVLIGMALMNEPRVLFLDEPTAGVDVTLRRELWDLLRALQRNGTTIILTTHYLEEAEMLSERVGIIKNGSLLLVERTDELLRRFGQRQWRIVTRDECTELPDTLTALGITRDTEHPHILLHTDTGAPLSVVLDALRNAGITIHDIDHTTQSLEDIFITLTENE